MPENGFSLKLLLFQSPTRDLAAMADQELAPFIPAERRRHLFRDALLVFTQAEPAQVREWLRASLGQDEELLVVEFERWAGYGSGVDRRWLLWHGH